MLFLKIFRATSRNANPAFGHPDAFPVKWAIRGIGVSPKVTQASSLCPTFPKHYFPHIPTLFSSTRDLFAACVIDATRLTGWKPVSPSTGSRPFLTGSGGLRLVFRRAWR